MAKADKPKASRKTAAKRAGRKPTAKKATPARPIAQPNAKLARVRELCARMLAAPDPALAQELEAEAGDLESFFANIRDQAQQFAQAKIKADASLKETSKAMRGLRGAFEPASPPADLPSPAGARAITVGEGAEVEEVFGIGSRRTESVEPVQVTVSPSPDSFDLAEFFRNVSRSVIDAQKELDRYSLQYARQQSTSSIPPALYSIPTVHAEIKAGLSKKDGSGILVQLFKDKSESDFTESTISFDVVASPPAPGGLRGFTAPTPPFLVVEGDDKSRVMTELGKLPKNAPFDDGWEERTIVIRDLDPILRALNRRLLLAFVFGAVPSPGQGSATDFSAVPLAMYQFTDDSAPLAVVADGVRAQFIRTLYSMASWLQSITVPV